MSQVDDLMDGFAAQIKGTVTVRCQGLARQVLSRALYYRERLVQSGIGHNFTGNFVNSIVCALFVDGSLNHIYLGSKEVGKPPIMSKMTTKSNGRSRLYLFGEEYSEALEKRGSAMDIGGSPNPDWSGSSSKYYAKVKTDTGTSPSKSAQHFVNNYKPSISKGFVIVLAYPAEYSEYIEKERNSTGMALVENEYTSKKGEVKKWITLETAISSPSSMKTTENWDRIFARNKAFFIYGKLGTDDNRMGYYKQIRNVMEESGYHFRPGIKIVSADNTDPAGGPDIPH